MNKKLLAITALFILTGCATVPRTNALQFWRPKAETIVEKNDEKLLANKEAEIANLKAQLKAVQDRLQAVSGPVAAAKDVNSQNPQPNRHTEVVNKELTSAQADLPAPTAQQLKENLERVTLALSKEMKDREKAETLYAGLLDSSAKRDEAYDKLLVENTNLVNERTALLTQNASLLKKISDDDKQRLAEQEEKAKRNANLQKYLMIFAGALFLGAMAGLYFQQKELAGYLGAGALLVFGVAWLVGQWWFPLLIIGIVSVAGIYTFYSIFRKDKLAKAKIRMESTAVAAVRGIEQARTGLKTLVSHLKDSGKPEEVAIAEKAAKIVNEGLADEVYDDDAAHVDEIRRSEGLI